MLVVATAMAVAVVTAAPLVAGESATKRATREIKVGYDAARAGYWQEALLRFRRADMIQPGQPRILNNIAVALEATARYEDALLAYEEAVAAAPGDPILRRNYKLFQEFYRQHIAGPETRDEQEDGGEAADDDQQ